jgi:hypothetical protein
MPLENSIADPVTTAEFVLLDFGKLHHFGAKVTTGNVPDTAATESKGKIARTAAHIQQPVVFGGIHHPNGYPSPAKINTEAENVIGQIVTTCDTSEYAVDPSGSFGFGFVVFWSAHDYAT